MVFKAVAISSVDGFNESYSVTISKPNWLSVLYDDYVEYNAVFSKVFFSKSLPNTGNRLI
jgi:hypothetical protein